MEDTTQILISESNTIKEESSAVTKVEEVTETEQEKDTNLLALVDIISEIYQYSGDPDNTFFKLDESVTPAKLHVLNSDVVDIYTYVNEKYICLERNVKEKRHEGYYRATDMVEYITNKKTLPEKDAIEELKGEKVDFSKLDWKSIYRSVVNSSFNDMMGRAELLDIDSNGIPELVYDMGVIESSNIYYIDCYGNVQGLETNFNYGYFKDNLVCLRSGHGGFYEDVIYEFSAEYGFEELHRGYINEWDTYTYEIDGKEYYTRDAYEGALDQILDQESATKMLYYTLEQMNRYTVLELIDNY